MLNSCFTNKIDMSYLLRSARQFAYFFLFLNSVYTRQ